jgi:hypothetical protein
MLSAGCEWLSILNEVYSMPSQNPLAETLRLNKTDQVNLGAVEQIHVFSPIMTINNDLFLLQRKF